MKPLAIIGPMFLLLSGCATSNIPLYDDVGIRLSGVLTGTLKFSDGCYSINSDSSIVYLVLPRGTKFGSNYISLPAENDGAKLALEETVTARGGYIEITDNPNDPHREAMCRGDAFIVNSLERVDAQTSI